MPDLSSFARLYNKDTGQYHCDWRLTIHDCYEAQSLEVVYIVNLVASFLLATIASFLLYRRLSVNGWTLRDPTRGGFLRPRPIECFMVCLIVFHTGFIGVDIVMLTGIPLSSSLIEVIWELPWPAMFFAVTLYTIGIIGTTPHMHRLGSGNAWFPSQNTVDIFGTVFLFAPSLINIATAFTTGHYIDANKRDLAELFIRLHYFLWATWCSLLLILIAHFGWRLTSIIDKHLADFNSQCAGSAPNVLKAGLVKLRIVLLEIALALFFFASGMMSYSFFRKTILSSAVSSVAFATVWILIVPFLSFVGLVVIAINPFEEYSAAVRRSTSMRQSFVTDNFSKVGGERDRSEMVAPSARRFSYATSNSSFRLMNEMESNPPGPGA